MPVQLATTVPGAIKCKHSSTIHMLHDGNTQVLAGRIIRCSSSKVMLVLGFAKTLRLDKH
jgi:hypothetical protein